MQCGVAPGYVLDEMEVYEIEALIENLWMRSKDSWEQARTVAYVTAQCQSTKHIDPKDLMTFPWEKELETHMDTPEEKEAMYREMKEMENRLNNK